MTPWLHIIGLGADGMSGLAPAARAALEAADVVIGGARHHGLTEGLAAERISWPSPFDALSSTLDGLRGRPVAVLATGDPSWFSVGSQLAAAFPGEATIHPHPGAFSLAAARLGWPLGEVETLTVHGRPIETLAPHITPGARLLALTAGSETPAELAALLTARGYGPSRLTVLGNLGAADETLVETSAERFDATPPALNTLAIEVIPGPSPELLPRTGLPDAAFASDGTMTKQEVRAITLARLMPMPGQLLWDIGAGSGSVGIEWMRAARGARAIGIEPRPDRRALAAANAARLGTPGLEIVAGSAPEALSGLATPDAIFAGGGLTEEVFALAWTALATHGRFVANAVTLETEAVLMALHARHGGSLIRLAVSRAEPIGPRTGWRAAMPVTQWSLIK